MNSPRLHWLLAHKQLFLNRLFLIETLTVTDHPKVSPLEFGQGSTFDYTGKPTELFPNITIPESNIVQTEDSLYGIFYQGETNTTTITLLGSADHPAFTLSESFTLEKEMIANFNEDTPITTTVGRFILNYVVLDRAFGSFIPYVNNTWNIGAVEKQIAAGILNRQLTAEQYDLYMNHMFFIGTFAELAVPVFSRKSLTTDPAIKQRKAELFEQYKDQLHDPLVISKIEDVLIAMDRDHLKDDVSYGFYGDNAKKFEVHRKKMFLTGGLVEAFDKDKTQYNFIPGALIDGWDIDTFDMRCNEIRHGSYNRGKETAKGGEQSKYLLRVFQNTKIVEEDCHTTSGLPARLDEALAKEFLGRYVVMPDNTTVALTSRNIKQFTDKDVTIRSLMYCKSPTGFCYRCAGDMFRALDSKAIGVMALDIGSAFLSNAMKAMHGSKMQSFEVTDAAEFFV